MPSPKTLFWLALLLLTAVRVFLASHGDLRPAEALAWMTAQRWGLTGLGGGQLAHLLMLPGEFLGNPIGGRILLPVVSLGSSYLLWKLLCSVGTERMALRGVFILNLLPVFHWQSIRFDPAAGAIFFGLAGIFLFWKGLHRQSGGGWQWAAAGIVWAASLHCHWGAVWFPLGVVYLLSASRRWRGHLFSPKFWLLLADWAFLGLGPILWWNGHHAGAGWEHLLTKISLTEVDPLKWQPLGSILVQPVLALTPFFLLALVAVAWRLWSRYAKGRAQNSAFLVDDGTLFLVSFLLPPLIICFLGVLVGAQLVATTVVLLPLAVALLAMAWDRDWLPAPVGRPLLGTPALILAAILSVLCTDTDVVRRITGNRFALDPLARDIGWPAAASEVHRVLGELADGQTDPVFVVANDSRLAATLEYYLPGNSAVFRPQGAFPRVHVTEAADLTSQHAFWPRYDAENADTTQEGQLSPFFGRDALFVTDATNRETAPENIERGFDLVQPLLVFDVTRDGRLLHRIRLWSCRYYRGVPL